MHRDDYKQTEKQRQREKMAEVRSYKRRSESLENKKKRYSENEQLIEQTQTNIRRINESINSLFSVMEHLDDESCALALGYNSVDEFLKDEVNLPQSTINLFRQLSKTKQSLKDGDTIDSWSVIDLFRHLKNKELADTTIMLINAKGLQPDLSTVIETIKRIHVEELNNFHIDETTLKRFYKCRYTLPTRSCVDTHLELFSDDIHTVFEKKINPSSTSARGSTNKGFGPVDFDE